MTTKEAKATGIAIQGKDRDLAAYAATLADDETIGEDGAPNQLG
ncbi:hypothetical protein [Granulicella sibirica]|uniref:Uncharacterized protein n=1 Tax=Granulicella sibirica TaxID=2479048 RepID=A0A4Q0T0M7_9BACT|nr:hypothetical protein [Granulicella sibirica]RXH55498.1 hypothetical protein GRAN_2355 [Granulicella sibirica]